MSTTLPEATGNLPGNAWGYMPARMRVLFITGSNRTGGWLAEAFAVDSAAEVQLEEAVGMAAGMSQLRDEVFDAVLVSHERESLDALDLLDAIRAGSSEEQPIVVLGAQSEEEMSALCYEAGGDAYVCVNSTTTRTLIWKVARAVERRQLIAETRRLQQAHRHRQQQEHTEATRLLEQQFSLIEDRELHDNETPNPVARKTDLPESLIGHYRELLRAHVIMGSGNMSQEMIQLADLLASVGATARQAMQLHLHVLEEMIDGLGSRSARHVMNRADLLILEMMMHLVEGYRDRLFRRIYPARQRMLPGFE